MAMCSSSIRPARRHCWVVLGPAADSHVFSRRRIGVSSTHSSTNSNTNSNIGLAPPVEGALYRNSTIKAPPVPETDCCPPADEQEDLRPVEGREADQELAAFAKALGHPARVRILRLLSRRTTCICGDIVEELDLAQSTVSQHLQVLKEAGLIRGEVDGPRVCYCAEPRALRRVRALVGSL